MLWCSRSRRLGRRTHRGKEAPTLFPSFGLEKKERTAVPWKARASERRTKFPQSWARCSVPGPCSGSSFWAPTEASHVGTRASRRMGSPSPGAPPYRQASSLRRSLAPALPMLISNHGLSEWRLLSPGTKEKLLLWFGGTR